MDVFILGAVRSPFGRFGGMLREVEAIDLGACVVCGVVDRAGIDPGSIGELIVGQVHSEVLGRDLAPEIASRSGTPALGMAYSVHQGPTSGLKAALLGVRSIQAGYSRRLVAVGIEHPSGAPYLLPEARWGKRLGSARLVDPLCIDTTGMTLKALRGGARCGVSSLLSGFCNVGPFPVSPVFRRRDCPPGDPLLDRDGSSCL